jgi:hypothetical protein
MGGSRHNTKNRPKPTLVLITSFGLALCHQTYWKISRGANPEQQSKVLGRSLECARLRFCDLRAAPGSPLDIALVEMTCAILRLAGWGRKVEGGDHLVKIERKASSACSSQTLSSRVPFSIRSATVPSRPAIHRPFHCAASLELHMRQLAYTSVYSLMFCTTV